MASPALEQDLIGHFDRIQLELAGVVDTVRELDTIPPTWRRKLNAAFDDWMNTNNRAQAAIQRLHERSNTMGAGPGPGGLTELNGGGS